MSNIKLLGRVFVSGNILAVTGLRIGGRPVGIEIGGLDNVVIRNPLNNEPYIPGSSLKGKMRSLMERLEAAPLNYKVGSAGNEVWFHSCAKGDPNYYATCDICRIFGLPGEGAVRADAPTRLLVRDVRIDKNTLVERVPTLTEVKWEAAIDRITAAANPRQMERVPAGAMFKEFELVYSLYAVDGQGGAEDLRRLPRVFQAMQLVEDDYLGGLGSRGSGKVRFENISIAFRHAGEKCVFFDEGKTVEVRPEGVSLDQLDVLKIKEWIESQIKPQKPG